MENKPDLLTVGQSSRELNLSPSTVRAWVFLKRIAVVKLGRAIRIKRSTIDELIENGTIPARPTTKGTPGQAVPAHGAATDGRTAEPARYGDGGDS